MDADLARRLLARACAYGLGTLSKDLRPIVTVQGEDRVTVSLCLDRQPRRTFQIHLDEVHPEQP